MELDPTISYPVFVNFFNKVKSTRYRYKKIQRPLPVYTDVISKIVKIFPLPEDFRLVGGKINLDGQRCAADLICYRAQQPTIFVKQQPIERIF